MRLAGRQRLGFYPLPIPEARRIRNFLRFPEQVSSTLDPCIGEGVAFAEITQDANTLRYGIDLDAERATLARSLADEVLHGNCFDVQCSVESFSLIYLNPPYDFEIGEGRSQRMEKLFLDHVYRWLKRAGVLVMVIPSDHIKDCAQVLSSQFRDVRIYRLTEPESVKYKQVAVFGVRRTRQERDRLQDSDITRARLWYESAARDAGRLPALPARHLRRGIHSVNTASNSAASPDEIPTIVPAGGTPTRGRTSACAGVVLTVSVTWPLPVIVFGFTKQAASTSAFGKAQVKAIAAVKFAESVTDIVELPDCPGWETLDAVALSEKSSAVTASASDMDSL